MDWLLTAPTQETATFKHVNLSESLMVALWIAEKFEQHHVLFLSMVRPDLLNVLLLEPGGTKKYIFFDHVIELILTRTFVAQRGSRFRLHRANCSREETFSEN